MDREAWFVLRARRPGVSAKELARKYGLEELRDYIDRSRQEIDRMRGMPFANRATTPGEVAFGIPRRALLAGFPGLAFAQNERPPSPRFATRSPPKCIRQLDLFDSHEHFWDERERTSTPFDLFSLVNDYVISDLTSAGLTPEAGKIVRDINAPVDVRWRAFEPFWQHARFTGYGQALRLAIRELFGVQIINETTMSKINGALKETNDPAYTSESCKRANLRMRAGRLLACYPDTSREPPIRICPTF